MSTFSKGDKVRCIKTWTTHVIDRGGEYTVEGVRPDNLTDTMEALVCGDWVPFSYFEKVEPEFVVGQQVSGSDYERLPIGARAGVGLDAVTKVGEHEWQDAGGVPLFQDPSTERTLTHLPDVAEPEDKDDLYVEPEPLKAGDWVWVAGQITETHQHPEDVTVEMFSHNEQYQADVRRDRVERMAGVPSWVKTAQNGDVEAIAEVLRSEGDMEYLASLSTAASLYRAGVRITEGGAS